MLAVSSLDAGMHPNWSNFKVASRVQDLRLRFAVGQQFVFYERPPPALVDAAVPVHTDAHCDGID